MMSKGEKAMVEKYNLDRQNWSAYKGTEHKNCRVDVVIIDVFVELMQEPKSRALLSRIPHAKRVHHLHVHT